MIGNECNYHGSKWAPGHLARSALRIGVLAVVVGLYLLVLALVDSVPPAFPFAVLVAGTSLIAGYFIRACYLDRRREALKLSKQRVAD